MAESPYEFSQTEIIQQELLPLKRDIIDTVLKSTVSEIKASEKRMQETIEIKMKNVLTNMGEALDETLSLKLVEFSEKAESTTTEMMTRIEEFDVNQTLLDRFKEFDNDLKTLMLELKHKAKEMSSSVLRDLKTSLSQLMDSALERLAKQRVEGLFSSMLRRCLDTMEESNIQSDADLDSVVEVESDENAGDEETPRGTKKQSGQGRPASSMLGKNVEKDEGSSKPEMSAAIDSSQDTPTSSNAVRRASSPSGNISLEDSSEEVVSSQQTVHTPAQSKRQAEEDALTSSGSKRPRRQESFAKAYPEAVKELVFLADKNDNAYYPPQVYERQIAALLRELYPTLYPDQFKMTSWYGRYKRLCIDNNNGKDGYSDLLQKYFIPLRALALRIGSTHKEPKAIFDKEMKELCGDDPVGTDLKQRMWRYFTSVLEKL